MKQLFPVLLLVHLSNLFDLFSCFCQSWLKINESFVFTALHGMQTRSSDEKAVCLSVRLSNACIVTKGKKHLSRFLYHTKDHLA